MSHQRTAMNYWRECFALASISEARHLITRLTDPLATDDVIVKKALWAAFVIAYSRAFTKNGSVGAISIKVVPKEMSQIHDAISNFYRNKYIGHIDPETRSTTGRQINELRIKKSQDGLYAFPLAIRPAGSLAQNASALTHAVFENILARSKEHYSNLPEMKNLPDGEYSFDFLRPEGKRCIPVDPLGGEDVHIQH